MVKCYNNIKKQILFSIKKKISVITWFVNHRKEDQICFDPGRNYGSISVAISGKYFAIR